MSNSAIDWVSSTETFKSFGLRSTASTDAKSVSRKDAAIKMKFNFMLDDQSHTTTRQVVTFLDACGDLGGLIEMAFLAVTFCVSGMAQKLY